MNATTRIQRGSRAALRAATCSLLVGASACATRAPAPVVAAPQDPAAVVTAPQREWIVTATAYNSTPAQTDSDPFITADGTRLREGMKVIAVSRDLEAQGLRPGARVQIEGLAGEWQVADRMPSHRRRAIDVYMGLDVAGAREFGKRQVRLRLRDERAPSSD